MNLVWVCSYGYVGWLFKYLCRFPIGFDSLKVLVSADGEKKDNQPHANVLNHLVFGISIGYLKGSKISKVLLPTYFEDTSGLRFANKADGLWGRIIKSKK